jgi:hypothetical protein
MIDDDTLARLHDLAEKATLLVCVVRDRRHGMGRPQREGVTILNGDRILKA